MAYQQHPENSEAYKYLWKYKICIVPGLKQNSYMDFSLL